MSDNLYAVRKFKKKLQDEKPPPFELRPGDLIIHLNETLIVVEVTDKSETLEEVVHLWGTHIPHREKVSIFKLKTLADRGAIKIKRGSAW